MNPPATHSATKAVDSIQERLASYAYNLNYDSLPREVIHAAKVRVIDTLGGLIAGFFDEPCRIARKLAADMPNAEGATVIGTRMRTTPDMAAFVNCTTARSVEMNDLYEWPGSAGGHPSDVIAAVLAAAEHAQLSGRDFITGVVLAYEVFLRFNDVFSDGGFKGFIRQGFDNTNFVCVGSAVGAGKMLGLSCDQLSHCISMAVVPNVILRQVRSGKMTMWKEVSAGQAARAAVFAALLARAGMEGPHLPFEGKAGWCEHVAKKRFTLDILGGCEARFKILDTFIKHRSSGANTIPSIQAAEKIAPLQNIEQINRVIVELYDKAYEGGTSMEHRWNPQSREAADHSVPYVIALTLMEGTVTRQSFDDEHLSNPQLKALMQKIEMVENPEFTKAYNRPPVEHRTRVTVVTHSGERLVGETGGGEDDLSAPKSVAQVEAKFRGLTEDFLGAGEINAILDRLWHLEDLKNVADIPPAFVLA